MYRHSLTHSAIYIVFGCKGQIKDKNDLGKVGKVQGKVHKAGVHRANVDVKSKVGLQRMSALADKLIWVKENLPGLVEEDGEVTKGNNKIN